MHFIAVFPYIVRSKLLESVGYVRPLINVTGFVPRDKVKGSHPYFSDEMQFPTHTTGLTNGTKLEV